MSAATRDEIHRALREVLETLLDDAMYGASTDSETVARQFLDDWWPTERG